jgi:DNA-binding transcriptional regulator YdaS (Cro superfamily)
MKAVKFIFSALGMLVVIAGIFLYINFGNLAKNAAERIASNALGVKVQIASLNFSLKDKNATVNGIKISNPPGFKNTHIITADNIIIGLNTASRELIDFKDIQVNGTVINLEVTEKGTNLNALKRLTEQKKQQKAVGSEQVRVIVRQMTISEATINPSVTLLDREIGAIKLPAFRVSGIGKNTNGVLAKDAVRQIMIQYIKSAERQVSREGLWGEADAIIKNVEDAVDDVKETFKGLFN